MDLKKQIMRSIPQPEVRAVGVVKDKDGNIKGINPNNTKEGSHGSNTLNRRS